MTGWEIAQLAAGVAMLGCASAYAFGPERWFVRGRRGPKRPMRLVLTAIFTLNGALQILNSQI